ncbi:MULTISPECIES: acetate/propionate family kinase [unclassified Mesorhizobium]|uniref:acetate/propionate family kinase n=1 Tax=unclassified Mesorhizobium TaxID=325217 RepID=UPI001129B156|nr:MULTISPECIES: acetate/propionate family kinase [unclassified Mesorhizobium]TPI54496.1 acetate/propionate family kinase [Mesorhizobium sp. B3-1-1]TPJ69967.1 acetate/propionate family kinase [Mesorhizobium sp. B2-6-7]TPJ82007.1 acetate/propionate family kinase [Mesorhizobium sp. B2-6-3]TPJ98483.1 acetate/propionate family kinase [Mesorhizobium sp. B2-5-10]TPK08579.1 acetate/propionate family kinase [Mesorhizobium sp. B2-5-11]
MTSAILALNAGSSSLKFGLFEAGSQEGPVLTVSGAFEDLDDEPSLVAKDASGKSIFKRAVKPASPPVEVLLRDLFDVLDPYLAQAPLSAVGHRIVHGGKRFSTPVLLTGEIVEALDALTPMAPLHQPAGLAPVRAISKLLPGLPQIGCFDTAFHRTLEPPVNRYALPREFEESGIRRYGFHGLSYEFVAGQLQALSPGLRGKRCVVAHLGSGCSLCAMREGRSLDTTMGFTALDGLMMATRPGAIDPGVLLYLQQARGMSVKELETLLYHKSGLLGVSGVSADVRTLLGSKDPRAAEAIDLFTFRIAREIAAMGATLQGIEALVFTGGIGEHSWQIREAVCERLRWLDVLLDANANRSGKGRITGEGSAVDVYAIATNEELIIARQVLATVPI